MQERLVFNDFLQSIAKTLLFQSFCYTLSQRQITDPDLLRKIILFLADNIGSTVSPNSIGNALINEGLLEGGSRKNLPSAHTVQAYVGALLESYIFYEIKRFDIKGKEFLRTLGKYYIADIGLRNYRLL